MSFEPHAGQGTISSSTVALSTPTESVITVAVMVAFPQRQRTERSSVVFLCFFTPLIFTDENLPRWRPVEQSQHTSSSSRRCAPEPLTVDTSAFARPQFLIAPSLVGAIDSGFAVTGVTACTCCV